MERTISPQEIQEAVEEVRSGDFWEFMFQDPSLQGPLTRRRRTSRRTSRRRTT